MDVSREELSARFREFSDEELLRHFQSGTLTPLAADVAGEALRSRGIEPNLAETPDSAVASVEAEGSGEVDLVTVAQFMNPLQANLLRACLESNGIFAYVWGEHLGTANIILSTATGGLRVQVRNDQVMQAKEVIATFERGELEIPENLEETIDDELSPEEG